VKHIPKSSALTGIQSKILSVLDEDAVPRETLRARGGLWNVPRETFGNDDYVQRFLSVRVLQIRLVFHVKHLKKEPRC
jgi:hypothetical protein